MIIFIIAHSLSLANKGAPLAVSVIRFRDAWSNSPIPSIGMQSTYNWYLNIASVFFRAAYALATRSANASGFSALNMSLIRGIQYCDDMT